MNLTAAAQDRLRQEPWLEAFIEPEDRSIDDAIQRFEAAERAAKLRLRAKGEAPHRRAHTATGLETTAIALTPQTSS